MLGLDDYGSGSESESEKTSRSVRPTPAQTQVKKQPVVAGAKLRPNRVTKKITIGLPSLSSTNDDRDNLEESEKPTAKRRKVEGGAGGSSLFSMLPAPKQTAYSAPSAPQRVLGGGQKPGLVFHTRPSESSTPFDPHEFSDEPTSSFIKLKPEPTSLALESGEGTSSLLAMLPPSVARGRPNLSLEEVGLKKPATKSTTLKVEPTVDHFSLSSLSTPIPKLSTTPTINTAPSTSIILPSVTSAPEVPTFEHPEPTPTDPYPGYYQLPSGAWAAYEQEYYASFLKKWQVEYNAHVRALEKGKVKGFEDVDNARVQDVDASAEMERAKQSIKEREERKALTQGAGTSLEQPKMKMNPSKLSGVARSRHQLSTLLNEAYTNREALEERIAQGRRNRKEAGNKYGF